MQGVFNEIGKKIRVVRKQKGFTQEDLAESIGMDPRSVVAIENGDRNPTVRSLYKICKALKISSSIILPF